MESWDRRDENFAQRMMASVDDQTVERVQKKTRELLHLMTHAEFTDDMAEELFQCAQLSAELDNRMDRLRKSVRDNGSVDIQATPSG